MYTGLIPSLPQTIARRRYIVTTSLIGWVQALHQPCVYVGFDALEQWLIWESINYAHDLHFDAVPYWSTHILQSDCTSKHVCE